MKLGGFVPFSTTDFPGQLSAVVFCQGCPWKCRYCHNPHLQRFEEGSVKWEGVLNFLRSRSGLLDAVVFSGGEPLEQPDLSVSLQQVRAMGFKTGLHTAGACPSRLPASLPHLDWIGFDVKAMPHSYEKVTGVSGSGKYIEQCLKLIAESGVQCEIRTTYHPLLLSEPEVMEIAQVVKSFGISTFVLQRFRERGCSDSQLGSAAGNELSSQLIQRLHQMFPEFSVR